MHDVLERGQKMQTTAQNIGLKAGFAFEGNEPGADRAAKAPALFDNADALVGDVADAGDEDAQSDEDEQRNRADDQGRCKYEIRKHVCAPLALSPATQRRSRAWMAML